MGWISFTDRWEGDRLSFEGGGLGQKLTGRVDVLPETVRIEVDLPELLAALANRIVGTLRDQTRKLLEKR